MPSTVLKFLHVLILWSSQPPRKWVITCSSFEAKTQRLNNLYKDTEVNANHFSPITILIKKWCLSLSSTIPTQPDDTSLNFQGMSHRNDRKVTSLNLHLKGFQVTLSQSSWNFSSPLSDLLYYCINITFWPPSLTTHTEVTLLNITNNFTVQWNIFQALILPDFITYL